MSKSIQDRLKSLERQYKGLCCKVNNEDSGGGVQSVTGLDTDNTDPLNPVVQIAVDNITITGDGTPGNPLVSTGGGGESLTVNGFSPVNDLTIQGLQVLNHDSTGALTLKVISEPLPYKAYRAKVAVQNIDWPGYGYLYNWFALTNAGKLENPSGGTGLTAPNEWRVPSSTDWIDLRTYIGVSGSAIKLRSTLASTAYPFYGWLNNNEGTDDYNFNSLPGGYRLSNGGYQFIGDICVFRTIDNSQVAVIIGTDLFTAASSNTDGYSVRLVREATSGELLLNDGDTSDTSSLDPYTGNDGKTYVTVKIGTQIWLAQNLRETKYNDNSDIFNASLLFGGDTSNATWQAKGTAQVGAWTAYLYVSGATSYIVEYDPTSITTFYNDVLENTLNKPIGFPFWVGTSNNNGPIYELSTPAAPWQKTHIKITAGYDINDFPVISERSLLIQEAFTGANSIIFRPIKRDNTGAITIEHLNNFYEPSLAITTSYVYVEILEYPVITPDVPYYYYSNEGLGIGISNL